MWRRWIFQFAFAAYVIFMVMYYHQSSGANANSRLLTVYGLVEQGTFRADAWADTTLDKAMIDGHVYSDKAPLASLIATPFYAAWRWGGDGPQSESDRSAAFHVAAWMCAATPFSIYVLILFRRVEKLGGAHPLTVGVVWMAVFGTFVVQYANGFFGHVLAGLLMVASVEFCFPTGTGTPDRGSRWRDFAAGLTGGLSVAAEYPMFITQAAILIGLLLQRRWGSVMRVVMGLAGPAVGLLIYNYVITGHVLRFPYQFVEGFPKMEATLGLGGFSFSAFWGLTFSLFRGAFVYAPSLAILLLVRSPGKVSGERFRSRLVLGCCWAQLLFFSSYAYWDGGGSAGPRFLVPAVMLLIYNRLPYLLLSHDKRIPLWKSAMGFWFGLGVIGIVMQGIILAIDALAPAAYANPLVEFYWVRLLRGQFNPHSLLMEWGLPASFVSIVFRSWFILMVAGGAVFHRWFLARSSLNIHKYQQA